MWDKHDFFQVPKTLTNLKLDVHQHGFKQLHELTGSRRGELLDLVQKHNVQFHNSYKNPLYSHMGILCSKECPLLHSFDVIIDLQVPKFTFNSAVTKIPTYKHWNFDVSIFCTITKHRGKRNYMLEVLTCLHFQSEFIQKPHLCMLQQGRKIISSLISRVEWNKLP